MDNVANKSGLRCISRRRLVNAAVVGLAFLAVTAGPAYAAGPVFAYVGSYTKDPPGGGNDNPVGLSVFRFDPDTGTLSVVQ